MSTDIDTVLARVAAGELTPGQALDLLGPDERADEQAPPPAAGVPGKIRRIVLQTSARAIQISTDPSVAEVSVFGDHEMRRSGDSLVIESPSALDDRAGRYSLAASIARAIPQIGSALEIRMNPALVLEGDLSAAAIKMQGAPAGLRLRLLASSLKIAGYVGSVDIDASSSSIKGEMTLYGQNRIDCESSSCKLSISEKSDITIRAQNQLGKLVLPTSVTKGSITGAERVESVIGRGRGSLAIDATMSSVIIGTIR
jgi:hypothetical protein